MSTPPLAGRLSDGESPTLLNDLELFGASGRHVAGARQAYLTVKLVVPDALDPFNVAVLFT